MEVGQKIRWRRCSVVVIVVMRDRNKALKEGGRETRPPGLDGKIREQAHLGDLEANRSNQKKKKSTTLSQNERV